MNYAEGKDKFIQTWGTLGSSWGISRTMAQVHALLLISPDALTTEDVMEDLKISRGNANMNLRDLMDWGLISKQLVAGERKEYFIAEKDIWKVAKQIIKERRKREIEPVLTVLEDFKKVKGEKNDKHHKAFIDAVSNIEAVVEKTDFALDKAAKLDENAFVGMLFKLFK
jgi:DNA-binding transcriptional regulator GbsR (MarR family)